MKRSILFLVLFMNSLVMAQTYSVFKEIGLHLDSDFKIKDGPNRCVATIESESLVIVISYGEVLLKTSELIDFANNTFINMSKMLPGFILGEEGLNFKTIKGLKFIFGECVFLSNNVETSSIIYFTSYKESLLMINCSFPTANTVYCKKRINQIIK